MKFLAIVNLNDIEKLSFPNGLACHLIESDDDTPLALLQSKLLENVDFIMHIITAMAVLSDAKMKTTQKDYSEHTQMIEELLMLVMQNGICDDSSTPENITTFAKTYQSLFLNIMEKFNGSEFLYFSNL